MSVLSRAAATAAAADPAFRLRVQSSIVAVAIDVHGGTGTYSQAQYDARAALAQAVCKAPGRYVEVFASAVTAKEWTPAGEPHCVPGAGDGTDPLLAWVEDTPTTQQIANADAALRAGISYAWDAIAATPEIV